MILISVLSDGRLFFFKLQSKSVVQYCFLLYVTVSIFGKHEVIQLKKTKTKLHGLSPRANYTDRATAACRRSDCQLVRKEGGTWSA
jgi:hypothetical protein